MRVLKLGCVGEDVLKWETFLKGLYSKDPIVVDQNFDQTAHVLTQKFQRDNGLTDDGVVGARTLGVAMQKGFNPGLEDDRVEIGPNWPMKPSSVVQMTPDVRFKTFGQFTYVGKPIASNPEAIQITDNWVAENIVSVHIKQLIGIPGAPKSGNIDLHKKVANQFVAMFQAWDDAGLKNKILTFGGSWVPRFIRGSRSSLSNHSWGTAIDLNVKWNPLGSQPALKGEQGSLRELAMIAAEYGQMWGGWFTSRPDGMHFETYKIV